MLARAGEVRELFEDLDAGVDVERDLDSVFGAARLAWGRGAGKRHTSET
jgi:hypothetical protein